MDTPVFPPDLEIPVIAYPTLSDAARMLGVSPSTLSRRNDIPFERMGDREKHIRPSDVLRLADLYRKVPVSQVAADLIDYARPQGEPAATYVENEVEEYYATRRNAPKVTTAQFLQLARASFAPEVVEAMEHLLGSAAVPVPPFDRSVQPVSQPPQQSHRSEGGLRQIVSSKGESRGAAPSKSERVER